jgi:hypothetical protein
MVHLIWKDPRFLVEGNKRRRPVWKLKELKIQTKNWIKEVKAHEKLLLENWESEIEQLLFKTVEGPLSLEDDQYLNVLETNRNSFLRGEEEAWRICSRVTWIKSGDSNTKFFHKMTSYNKNRKHVWELISGNGDKLIGQKAIKEEDVNYLKKKIRAKDRTNYSELVRISNLYPSMVNEDEAETLFKPVTLEEIKSVLENFKKERSPGPDGWTTEFFIFFFDLVGDDLLDMVEDSRRKGQLCGGLNSTFLALIPKVNKLVSFDDYRPISLCNLIYKVISKILANRIKSILSKCLSSEQLGS